MDVDDWDLTASSDLEVTTKITEEVKVDSFDDFDDMYMSEHETDGDYADLRSL